MDERKVQRINELTRISRERELTEEEQQERQALRMEYVESVKKNLAAQLNLSLIHISWIISPVMGCRRRMQLEWRACPGQGLSLIHI